VATFYSISRAAWHFCEWNGLRDLQLHRERIPGAGPYILAVTHLSHLEPAIVSTRVPHRIRWMARAEYYRYRIGALLLDGLDAIRLKRRGVPVTAIRTAITCLKGSEVIGIFPEGGVTVGRDSVLRGGPLRGGAALLAVRSGAPIIPVVVLGTEKLNRIRPWLPWRRGRVHLNFGVPMRADPRLHRRAARHELTERMRSTFVELYRELLEAAKLRDDEVP
jgi:1-acyl-sn-glycerol-3-phosphate acyltransferase